MFNLLKFRCGEEEFLQLLNVKIKLHLQNKHISSMKLGAANHLEYSVMAHLGLGQLKCAEFT